MLFGSLYRRRAGCSGLELITAIQFLGSGQKNCYLPQCLWWRGKIWILKAFNSSSAITGPKEIKGASYNKEEITERKGVQIKDTMAPVTLTQWTSATNIEAICVKYELLCPSYQSQLTVTVKNNKTSVFWPICLLYLHFVFCIRMYLTAGTVHTLCSCSFYLGSSVIWLHLCVLLRKHLDSIPCLNSKANHTTVSPYLCLSAKTSLRQKL